MSEHQWRYDGPHASTCLKCGLQRKVEWSKTKQENEILWKPKGKKRWVLVEVDHYVPVCEVKDGG